MPARRHRPVSSRDDPRNDPRYERRREAHVDPPPGDWGQRSERGSGRHGHRRRDPRGDLRGEPGKRRRHHRLPDEYDPHEPREHRRDRRRRRDVSPGGRLMDVQERPMKRRRRCAEDYGGRPRRQLDVRPEERRVAYGRRYDDRREEYQRSHRAGVGNGVSAAGVPGVGVGSHQGSLAPPPVPTSAPPQDADDSCSSSYSESSIVDGAAGPPATGQLALTAYPAGSMPAEGSFAASSTATPTAAPRVNTGGGAVSKLAPPGMHHVSCSESDDESSDEDPVDLAVPNVPPGPPAIPTAIGDNPRPRSVDRSPGSSETSRHHRWADDRGCSPPLASRSRSGSPGAARGGPGDPMARMSILKKRLTEKCQQRRHN